MNGERIEISGIRSVFNNRFRTEAIEFEMRFKENTFESVSRDQSLVDVYQLCFQEMLNFVRVELNIRPRDKIGIKFQIPTFDDVTPFGLRFLEYQEISPEIITDLLMSVQQSNTVYASNELLNVSVIAVHTDTGGARVLLSRIPLDNYRELCKVKRNSILLIPNESEFDDNKCLARALVMGKAWEDSKHEKKKFRRLFWSNNLKLKRSTDQLIKKTFGFADNYQKSGSGAVMADLSKFAAQMKNYQIMVYDDVHLHNKAIFCTKKCKRQINLFFLRNQKHFIALSNVKTFFGAKYDCECGRILLYTKSHRCSSKCSSCFSSPACKIPAADKKQFTCYCNMCNRWFRNQNCLKNHNKRVEGVDYTVCQNYRICRNCFKFIDKAALKKYGFKNHFCQKRVCMTCSEYVPLNHYCTVQAYTKKMPKKFILVFFDLETVQKKVLVDKKNRMQYEHEPILLCADQVCHECWQNPDKNFVCKKVCKQRSRIFEGHDCVTQFLNYLTEYKTNVPNIVCLSHNGKSFDSVFILAALLNIKNHSIEIIQNGFKILKIVLKKYIQFIDSIMFLPMALAQFPKAFGLSSEFNKGFFPYLFMSFDNWDYIGSLPEEKYFGVHENDEERYKEFRQWYEENKNANYNLREQAILYCLKDVTLLRLGCLKFLDMIIELSEINPFVECFTLAQLALTIYRKKFMPVNSLGIVPANNYHSNTNQSNICRKWLAYLNYFQPRSSTDNYFIECEVNLPDCKISVDGYCKDYPMTKEKTKGTVFEFSGCYFHGCPLCFPSNTLSLSDEEFEAVESEENSGEEDGSIAEPNAYEKESKRIDECKTRGILLSQNYQRTIAKLKRLKELGYSVVHCWEHDFVRLLKDKPQVHEEITKHAFMQYSSLNARDALYGGRNEAGRLYYKTKGNEKIRFYDYCSLYSYSMLTTNYFLREPKKIYQHKECDLFTAEMLSEMDGLAFVTVLPNPNLFYPVLPYRASGKLMFPSCKTCSEQLNCNGCKHADDDRAITGTYSLTELKEAFKRGYKLIKTIELWEFDSVCGSLNGANNEENDRTLTYEDLVKQEEEEIEKKNDGNVQSEIGFFTSYLKTFLRLKGEASGYPFGCENIEEKKHYIVRFYYENLILLRLEHVEKNASKRSLAKLMLNALFGKLVQQEKNQTTSILRDRSDLEFYMNSSHHIVTDLYCPNDNYAVISWKYVESDGNVAPEVMLREPSAQKYVSITTGIQTTAGARMRLYTELEKMGDRVFYMDTDSLLFLERESDEYSPKLSSAVGGLSSELEGDRKLPDFEPYIDEFVCIGPKSYAYRVINEPPASETFKPIYRVKCKGFRITAENAAQINMETMKSFVLGTNFSGNEDEYFYTDKVPTKRMRIKTLKHFKCVTTEETKLFGLTFDKRVVEGDDFITYPYGYCHSTV